MFFDTQLGTFRFVHPLGNSYKPAVLPWEAHTVTAAIPHLNTLEPLKLVIALLREQTVKPFLMVIDTGSPPDVLRELETLRAPDLEIHYVQAHAYRHSSEPVTVALDLAQTLCRTKHLFHTHADCFLRRRDLLEDWMRICTANTPAIGYRMSPRDWITDEWEWMVGHTALMLYMPSIHRIGATWSFQRIHYAYGYPFWQGGGWPDTETGFNCALRDGGIKPVFLGFDRNYERQIDDNIDHCRSFPGSKIPNAGHGDYHEKAIPWMKAALQEGAERLQLWRSASKATIAQGPQTAY